MRARSTPPIARLQATYVNAFKVCATKDARTVALPAFGAGVKAWRPRIAAAVSLAALSEFDYSSNFDDLAVVLGSDAAMVAFTRAFEAVLGEGDGAGSRAASTASSPRRSRRSSRRARRGRTAATRGTTGTRATRGGGRRRRRAANRVNAHQLTSESRHNERGRRPCSATRPPCLGPTIRVPSTSSEAFAAASVMSAGPSGVGGLEHAPELQRVDGPSAFSWTPTHVGTYMSVGGRPKLSRSVTTTRSANPGIVFRN